jgi:hypothetical protein
MKENKMNGKSQIVLLIVVLILAAIGTTGCTEPPSGEGIAGFSKACVELGMVPEIRYSDAKVGMTCIPKEKE